MSEEEDNQKLLALYDAGATYSQMGEYFPRRKLEVLNRPDAVLKRTEECHAYNLGKCAKATGHNPRGKNCRIFKTLE